jgi:transcriptional regulator with XRE-family HTH domain
MALTIGDSNAYHADMEWREKAKLLIKKSGKTQYWFAERLGLEPYELSRYLSKKSSRRMPVDLVIKLAEELKVPPATIFTEDEQEDKFLQLFYSLEKDQRNMAIKFFNSIKESPKQNDSAS